MLHCQTGVVQDYTVYNIWYKYAFYNNLLRII